METKQAMEFFGKQREAFDVALKLALILNGGNYFYNKGFLMGYQVSCDFIFSTTPTWVYLLSIIPNILPEGVKVDARKSKIALVFTTILGVWFISFDDLSRGTEMFTGDMYSLFAAIFYALYAVGLGVLVKSDDFEFGSFLGFVGVINCLITLPLLFVLHWKNIEIFEMPPAKELYLLFIYSLLCSLLTEYFWAKTATLLGATFSTVAYTLVTLPIGVLIDYLVVDNN
jgi:drug/metabolite transporter (DMT)-like permease